MKFGSDRKVRIVGAGLAGSEAAWQCARRGVAVELFEMRRAGSLLLEIARQTAVPAGHALAVDRIEFSRQVTEAISREPLIAIRREEVTQVEAGQFTIIATGPL